MPPRGAIALPSFFYLPWGSSFQEPFPPNIPGIDLQNIFKAPINHTLPERTLRPMSRCFVPISPMRKLRLSAEECHEYVGSRLLYPSSWGTHQEWCAKPKPLSFIHSTTTHSTTFPCGVARLFLKDKGTSWRICTSSHWKFNLPFCPILRSSAPWKGPVESHGHHVTLCGRHSVATSPAQSCSTEPRGLPAHVECSRKRAHTFCLEVANPSPLIQVGSSPFIKLGQDANKATAQGHESVTGPGLGAGSGAASCKSWQCI